MEWCPPHAGTENRAFNSDVGTVELIRGDPPPLPRQVPSPIVGKHARRVHNWVLFAAVFYPAVEGHRRCAFQGRIEELELFCGEDLRSNALGRGMERQVPADVSPRPGCFLHGQLGGSVLEDRGVGEKSTSLRTGE